MSSLYMLGVDTPDEAAARAAAQAKLAGKSEQEQAEAGARAKAAALSAAAPLTDAEVWQGPLPGSGGSAKTAAKKGKAKQDKPSTGTALAPGAPAAEDEPAPMSQAKKIGLIAAVAAGGLALVAGVLALIFGGRGQ